MALNQTQRDARDQAERKAIMAILEEIAKFEKMGSTTALLQMAEAYAWLAAPAQPHGSRSS